MATLSVGLPSRRRLNGLISEGACTAAVAAAAAAAASVANKVTRCRDPLSGNDPLGKNQTR